MNRVKMNEGNAIEKRYETKCCECGHVFYATKSIMQEDFGVHDGGHAHCSKCKEFLNLTYDPTTKTMKTTKWDDYVEQRKDKTNGNSRASKL